MASRNHGGGGGGGGGAGEEQLKKMAELSKTLKEGERIVAPSRRPDGTFRKPIRIRAGFSPQDEVAIYQSKGALWKKEMESAVPPGYDPALDTKSKTKSAKRNERKKEKRLQQAALEKGKNLEAGTDGEMKAEETLSTEDAGDTSETVKSLTSQMKELAVTAIPLVDTPSADSIDSMDPDIDKKIRALTKKIRLAEEKQQRTVPLDLKPEQMDRSKKLESWRQELKCLEDTKAERAAS